MPNYQGVFTGESAYDNTRAFNTSMRETWAKNGELCPCGLKPVKSRTIGLCTDCLERNKNG